MPRKARTKTELTPEQRRMARKLKRQARKDAALNGMGAKVEDHAPKSPFEVDQFWGRTRGRMVAIKLVNQNRERPYWLSIKRETSNPPAIGFYPCTMFERRGRWYFGFLLREHRDRLYDLWRPSNATARKELTGSGWAPLM